MTTHGEMVDTLQRYVSTTVIGLGMDPDQCNVSVEHRELIDPADSLIIIVVAFVFLATICMASC